MQFIEFDKTKCDSCYKCLRVCPTKAISFFEDQREIMDDLCIKCGLCVTQCANHALTTANSTSAVKNALKEGKTIHVSIAPSFAGAFYLEEPEVMVTALRSLGFDCIEETAVGADLVMEGYKGYMKEVRPKQVITSCCPSINYLIEQHFPKLVEDILPVVSPMVAHGRFMKQRYGREDKVVFIGPCLAKMAEAEIFEEAIDYVLTFEDIKTWLEEERIKLEELSKGRFDVTSSGGGKGFPLGIPMKSLLREIENEAHYEIMKVNGQDGVLQLLKEISNQPMEGYCFELNVCEGSCNNGPHIPCKDQHRFKREVYMRQYVEKHTATKTVSIPENLKDMLQTDFNNHHHSQRHVPYEEAVQVLRQMGKYTKNDELNCGACGYRSCREKADAVVLGHSDINNCLAYLRGKAENFHSVLIENSPNGVCIIDKFLNIVDYNPTLTEMLGTKHIRLKGANITTWMEGELFIEAFRDQKHIQGKRVHLPLVDRHMILNVIYHDREDLLMVFFTDITMDVQKKKALEEIKRETLLKTQEVIDKQMRVAQEIASLLGETTAETKMSLIGLRDYMLEEEAGDF